MKWIILVCLIAITPIAIADKSDKETIVAVYDLEGMISESGHISGRLFGLGRLNSNRLLTHYDIVRSMKAAAADDNVKGVVLDIGGAEINLAQLQEMRRCLMAIREAGKDVWFYTENLSNSSALIGSASNHFTLLPEGNVMLIGMYAESMYFKGLLDKLGIKVEVVHIGDFKSAGETFYRTEPSKYAAKQQEALLDSMFEQMISQVCEGRKIKPEALRQFIDKAPIKPEDAKQANLVDALQYRTDFITTIRKHYGKNTKFDREYELPNLDGPEITGFMDIMRLVFKSSKAKKRDVDYVGVVVLDDDIDDASVAPVREEILKLAKDEKCKALVFRVNSPGGTALASDVLWEATDQFKATSKPMVVSMGEVAASGGYYVSAGANRIFAEEGTITGSIGVLGMKYVLGGAMNKLGITTHSIKRGKHADVDNRNRGFMPAEIELIREALTDVYGTFKKRIVDGRGDRIKGDLEKLAGGRIYSGKDALAIGLVDEIGGINEAISHAAKLAKLEEYETIFTPEPKSGLEAMFPSPNEKHDAEDEFIRATTAKNPANLIRQHMLSTPGLQLLQPSQLHQLEKLVKLLESSQKNSIQLISPDFHILGL